MEEQRASKTARPSSSVPAGQAALVPSGIPMPKVEKDSDGEDLNLPALVDMPEPTDEQRRDIERGLQMKKMSGMLV